MLVEYGDKNSTLQGVYQKLVELHRYLLAIQNAPVPGKAALSAVRQRLEQHNSDPIFEVQQLAKNLPAPLNRWVGELAEQAWRGGGHQLAGNRMARHRGQTVPDLSGRPLPVRPGSHAGRAAQ